jgi:O-antigen/teichoic acid export membrane protein
MFAESVYGTYYLGASELPVPSMICTAVMSVLMADLVALAERGDHSRLLALWHRAIEKVSLVSLPFFAFAMLFAEPIFVACYGQAHAGAAGQFRIFQLLLLFRVTNFSNVSLALGQPRVPLIAALIALGLNAVLSLLAVRMLGLSGPALANVTSIALSTVYTLWAIRRRLGVAWSTLLPSRAYLRALGIALISALPASAVLLLHLPAALTLVAGALCYLVVYLYLCQAASLLTAEDRAFVREIFQLRFLSPAAGQGAIS